MRMGLRDLMLLQVIEDPGQTTVYSPGRLLMGAFVLFGLLIIIRCINSREAKAAITRKHQAVERQIPWKKLYAMAERIIHRTVEALPEELRDHARDTPWTLKDWPDSGPSVLGVYSHNPRLIVIYIGCLYEDCRQNNLSFSNEVRITYLHELGHSLGLTEDEIRARGLL